MRIHGDPPFSKFANALGAQDSSRATLAGEGEGGNLTGEEEAQAFGTNFGCGECLVAGSAIEMADGTTKAIETLLPNDLVMSRNPETGKTEPERVIQTISRKTAVLVTLTFTSPKTGKAAETMICSPDHPIFVQGKGWVPAGMLTVGDLAVTSDSNSLVVKSITWQRDEKQGFIVYNLTIADDHTYFVGKYHGGVWIHNACKLKFVGGGTLESPAGLRYSPYFAGHRLDHVIDHMVPNPAKPLHSVFSLPEGEVISTVDEAWMKRGIPVSQGPNDVYHVDLSPKVVGTNGETKIRIVVIRGTNEVVIAFPEP